MNWFGSSSAALVVLTQFLGWGSPFEDRSSASLAFSAFLHLFGRREIEAITNRPLIFSSPSWRPRPFFGINLCVQPLATFSPSRCQLNFADFFRVLLSSLSHRGSLNFFTHQLMVKNDCAIVLHPSGTFTGGGRGGEGVMLDSTLYLMKLCLSSNLMMHRWCGNFKCRFATKTGIVCLGFATIPYPFVLFCCNLRAASLIPLFYISSFVLLPSRVDLSVLSCSAFGPFCWLCFP